MRVTLATIGTVVAVSFAAAPLAAQAQLTSAQAAQQCSAEIKGQIQAAIQPFLNGPADQLAKAYGDALDKAPSAGECVAQRTRPRSGGGGSDDSVAQESTLQNNGPQGPLADAVAQGNNAVKAAIESATFVQMPQPQPNPSPSPKKTIAIAGAAAAGVGVALAARGGGSSSTASPASTPAAPATPTPTPPPTANAITGTFIGKATLQTDVLTCKGSDVEYNEKAIVNISAAGSGTIIMQDTAGFDRPYNISSLTPSGFSTQGTFPFLGASVPATLTGSFSGGGTQLTVIEQTTWNGCINRYQSVLTKQ